MKLTPLDIRGPHTPFEHVGVALTFWALFEHTIVAQESCHKLIFFNRFRVFIVCVNSIGLGVILKTD